jgi:hypothetical protein
MRSHVARACEHLFDHLPLITSDAANAQRA